MNKTTMIQRALPAGLRAGRRIVLPLLAAFATMSAQAQVLISFDDVPGDTVINRQYLGVTFANPLGGNVYATTGPVANSARNTVSIQQGYYNAAFSARIGAVDATFLKPQAWVSIDVAAARNSGDGYTARARPFIEAYDEGGALVGKAFFLGTLPPSGGITPWEAMTVATSSAIIKRVRFSVQSNMATGGPEVFGYFDNLRFPTPLMPVRCPRFMVDC